MTTDFDSPTDLGGDSLENLHLTNTEICGIIRM